MPEAEKRHPKTVCLNEWRGSKLRQLGSDWLEQSIDEAELPADGERAADADDEK